MAEVVETSRVASLWFTKCGLRLLKAWKIPLDFFLSIYKLSCITVRICFGAVMMSTASSTTGAQELAICLQNFLLRFRKFRAFEYYKVNETWPGSTVELVSRFMKDCITCGVAAQVPLPDSPDIFVGTIKWLRSQLV